MKTITIEFTREELCILQQALELRKTIQVNTANFTKIESYTHKNITDTIKLRGRICTGIRQFSTWIKKPVNHIPR